MRYIVDVIFGLIELIANMKFKVNTSKKSIINIVHACQVATPSSPLTHTHTNYKKLLKYMYMIVIL